MGDARGKMAVASGENRRKKTEHSAETRSSRVEGSRVEGSRVQEREGRTGLFTGGFGAGETALEEFDLAVVVGLVFGDMKPFAVIVGGSPAPVFVHGHEPLVIALAKFGESFLAGFPYQVQIVIEIVAFDGFARGFAEAAGHVPLLFDAVRPTVPLEAIESVELEKRFDGGQMQEEGANAVGFVVEEEVELLGGKTFGGHQNLRARESHHGGERPDFRGEAFLGADDGVGFVRWGRCGRLREKGYTGESCRERSGGLEEATACGPAVAGRHKGSSDEMSSAMREASNARMITLRFVARQGGTVRKKKTSPVFEHGGRRKRESP